MVQVSVTILPVEAAPANSRRKSITFYNASTLGETINLGKNGRAGLAANNREYVISPGSGISFMVDFDGSDIKNAWGAYASADTAILVVGDCAERGA